MELNCAYIRCCRVLTLETITVPSDASLQQLCRVVREKATTHLSISEDALLRLHLTNTPSSNADSHSSAWLERDALPLVDASLVERGCFKLQDGATTTGEAVLWSTLFGSGFVFEERDIHVVASIHDDNNRDGVGPPRKRVCAKPCQYTRPRAVLDRHCVPLDTIDAFQDIRVALTLRGPKPVVLLHGARFSVKTTISRGIYDWVQASVGPDEECFLEPLEPVGLDVADMWMQLSRGVDLEHPCTYKASFLKALAELPCKWRLIVFLVLMKFVRGQRDVLVPCP